MKLLIAEDDFASALVLEKALSKEGFEVVVVRDGRKAIEKLKHESFDALLTDWMMPEVDGVELIRWARKNLDPVPLILMLTVITNPAARAHALEAGADEFIEKPYELNSVITIVKQGLSRKTQAVPDVDLDSLPPEGEAEADDDIKPGPHIAVLMAAGAGGPQVLEEIFRDLPWDCKEKAVFFIVLQGPDWLVYDVKSHLEQVCDLKVELAREETEPEANAIYLAHGEKHLTLDAESGKIRLSNAPPENFLRPSADVLFRSAAQVWQKRCIAVVLSGIGCDGVSGCAEVKRKGGLILVQDPSTAVAPAMPRNVIAADLVDRVLTPPELAESIGWYISSCSPADITATSPP